MNKTVEDALNELIEFYSITDINDLQYLKKLFVRNLKDVRRRWIKYDKPIREDYLKQNRQIIKAKEFIEENKQLKDKLSKIETLIINHNRVTGDIYYKYNSKFLKSLLKQRILEILYEKRSDSNE